MLSDVQIEPAPYAYQGCVILGYFDFSGLISGIIAMP